MCCYLFIHSFSIFRTSMASRILTFVSCTLYLSFLIIITVVGFTSIIIGFVGLGLYISSSLNFNSYNSTLCFVIDHDYDTCHQQNEDLCFLIMWSVEYTVPNSDVSDRYIFSTITKTYDTPQKALNDLDSYKDNGTYTSYYHRTHFEDVKWEQPSSPTPYLIMMIVGFALTLIYFVVITSLTIYHRFR